MLSRWRTLLGSDRGSILLLTAFATLALIGMVGLGLDSGLLYQSRRMQQTAADAGALSAAAEIMRCDIVDASCPAIAATVLASAQFAAAQNGFVNGTNGVTVTVNYPPTAGTHQDAMHVEVIVAQPQRTFLMGLFGFSSANVLARAVAGLGPYAVNCIDVLDPVAVGALSVSGSLTAGGCGIAVDSNQSPALQASGALAGASLINVNGGVSGAITPTPATAVPRVTDPLASLQLPPFSACSAPVSVTSGTVNLTAGEYCGGISVSNGATLVLGSGTYVINSGGLSVTTGATLQGSGVTIYLTGGSASPLTFDNTVNVTLSAPAAGTYAGVLFFGDRTYTTTNSFAGNTSLTGLLYFPTETLTFAGNETITGGIIADTVQVTGNLTVNPLLNGSAVPNAFLTFVLVE